MDRVTGKPYRDELGLGPCVTTSFCPCIAPTSCMVFGGASDLGLAGAFTPDSVDNSVGLGPCVTTSFCPCIAPTSCMVFGSGFESESAARTSGAATNKAVMVNTKVLIGRWNIRGTSLSVMTLCLFMVCLACHTGCFIFNLCPCSRHLLRIQVRQRGNFRAIFPEMSIRDSRTQEGAQAPVLLMLVHGAPKLARYLL